jgi:hypothetical protein
MGFPYWKIQINTENNEKIANSILRVPFDTIYMQDKRRLLNHENNHKMRFIPLLLTLLLVIMMAAPTIPSVSLAAQPTVNLGTTKSFAALAGSEIEYRAYHNH